MLLHVAAAYASDGVKYSARIVRLRTEEERSEWCGQHKRIEACTRFVALQLTAQTIESAGAWHVSASAQFIAMIGMQDMSRYAHEMNHVHDVESAIDSYLRDVETVSFPTRDACEDARAAALNRFEARVRSFVEASNLLRDQAAHPER
jgi:hypothetical protein